MCSWQQIDFFKNTLSFVQVQELAEQHCAADGDVTGLFQICFAVHEQLEAGAGYQSQAASAELQQPFQQQLDDLIKA